MFAGVITKTILESNPIVAKLATYNGKPAIYTGGLPDDAKYPAILIEEIGGEPWGCRSRRGSEMTLEIKVFDSKEFTRKEISDLARMIWDQVDRSDLDPYITNEGYENWGCTAHLPTFHDDGLNFPGYLIRVNLRVLVL